MLLVYGEVCIFEVLSEFQIHSQDLIVPLVSGDTPLRGDTCHSVLPSSSPLDHTCHLVQKLEVRGVTKEVLGDFPRKCSAAVCLGMGHRDE